MKGKVFVGAAEAGNKVVFEYADGAFSLVATMCVWRDELVVNMLFGEVLLEDVGGFVVQSLKLWSESTGDEDAVNTFEGVEVVGC